MTREELGVEAGQLIAGKYRLRELLGRGGMGSVWRCDHLELSSSIALKIIKPDVAKNQNSVARFMREAKAAAMLRSPHVVQIFEHGTEGSVVYIAMELLEGESLLQRIKRQQRLAPNATATIMRHVGRAMQKAHDAGIIHRDLKPDNVFIIVEDDEIIAKVLDFGIAKSSVFALNQTGESPQTQTGALLGTPYYMSPEQATGQKDVDHRSDLWAIGVITYECLLGKRPYQSDSLGDLVLQICSRAQPVPSHHGTVPPGFDAWFQKAQERDPAQRWQSAKEMTRALREILTASGAAPRAAPPRRSVPPPRLPQSSGRSASAAPITVTALATPHGHAPLPFDAAHTPAPATPPIGTPGALGVQPTLLEANVEASGESARPSSDAGHGGYGVAESSGGYAGMSSGTHPQPQSIEASGSHARPGLSLETLDPLSATTAPKRKRAWLGIGAGLAVLTVGGIVASRLLDRAPAGSAPASSVASDEPSSATLPDDSAGAEPSAPIATPTSAAPVVDLDEAPLPSASAPLPIAIPPLGQPKLATPKIAQPKATQPKAAPPPPPPPPPVVKPKPTEDVLGI
jgi:serine/threonine-protein kinase